MTRIERLRTVCLALPETEERETWGDVTFRVREKTVASYVGRYGWVSVDLTGDVDWDEVRELVLDSYRLVVPKTLAKQV